MVLRSILEASAPEGTARRLWIRLVRRAMWSYRARGFFFNDTATPEIYTVSDTLSLHDALPICLGRDGRRGFALAVSRKSAARVGLPRGVRFAARLQRLHGAARARIGRPRVELHFRQPRDRALARRMARGRSGHRIRVAVDRGDPAGRGPLDGEATRLKPSGISREEAS